MQDALVAAARGSVAAAGGDIRRLEIEPMLALEVDGLARLVADRRVQEIHPDRPSRPFGQPSLKLIGHRRSGAWAAAGRGRSSP
jgi:hypothetical protein